MKKFLVAVVFACAVSALAQSDSNAIQTPDQGTGQPQQKTIKDPAEYNAYMTASSQPDPGQKASGLEAFADQYPSSVVVEDALESAMAAYQQAGNAAKATAVANRLLSVSPNSVAALAVLVYGKRQAANSGQNPIQNLNEASEMAKRGLNAVKTRAKPADLSEEDFNKRQAIFNVIFHGAIGQAALANKDFATAQSHLFEAAKNNPNDVNDIYPLALAYLTAKPESDEAMTKGLWFIARAAGLLPAPTSQQVADFGRKTYKKYHGSEEGWAQLLEQTKTTALPPAGFAVTKYIPPTPAERASAMIAGQDIAKMDFGQWIFILTSGNQTAADKVWATLEHKALRFLGKIIESSKTELTLAVTADGFEANKAEVTVKMATPYRVAPTVGSQVKLQAVPVSYTVSPFMMILEEGTDLEPPKAAPAVKKKPAPVRRKR